MNNLALGLFLGSRQRSGAAVPSLPAPADYTAEVNSSGNPTIEIAPSYAAALPDGWKLCVSVLQKTTPPSQSLLDLPDVPWSDVINGLKVDVNGVFESGLVLAEGETGYWYFALVSGGAVRAWSTIQSVTRPVDVTLDDMAITGGDGDVVFTLEAGDDELTIDVSEAVPTDYEQTYSLLTSALSDGHEVLDGPEIEPSDGVTIGEDGLDVITAYPSLIAYRADLYAAANSGDGIDFLTHGQWHRDGSPIGTSFQITGAPVSYTPDALGSYTLVETIPDLVGGTQTVTSPAVVASGAFTLTSELMDDRWIDMGGIVEDTRRIAVVALFDDATAGGFYWQNGTHASNVLSNVYFWGANTGTGPRGKFADPANTYGGTVTTTGVLDSTPRPTFMIQVGDLDRDASNRATNVRQVSQLNEKDVSHVSSATPPVLPVDMSNFAMNQGSLDGLSKMPLGMKLRFLWVATVFPIVENNFGTVSTGLRDAFFVVSGTAPNITFTPKPIAADGTITIDGQQVTPEIFLRGPQFGQYDAGGGIKKLTNWGTGADPILNGDFFA